MNGRYFLFTSLLLILVNIFLFSPVSAYALDVGISNQITSVSGEYTEEDAKSLMTASALAQDILDGGQLDFSEVDSAYSWFDFLDAFMYPIVETIDEMAPIDTNLTYFYQYLNSLPYEQWDNQIIRNMDGSDAVKNTFRYLMRSNAQKGKNDGYSLGEFGLNLAKTAYELSNNDSDTPSPDPDINYLSILDVINGNGTQILTQFNDRGLWVGGYNNNSYVNYNNYELDYASYSWDGYEVQTSDIITINIFSTGENTYNFTVQSIPVQNCNQTAFYSWAPLSYTTSVYNWGDIGVITEQRNNILTRTWSGTLSQCLYYISNNFKNVNIYVDDVPWSIVGYSSNRFTFGGATVYSGTNQPVRISIPDFDKFDYGKFIDIIERAIHNSSIVKWEDIADCFLDINGQTCVAVYDVARNDYDALVAEQFNMVTYPRFNDNLWLTNLAEEMTQSTENGVTIIKYSYEVFPLPLQKALLYCGALLLFGFLIRRFLE